MKEGDYIFHRNKDGGHDSAIVVKRYKSGWLLIDSGDCQYRVKESNCILQSKF